MTKKVSLYARCSTSKQDLEGQINALKAWADAQGYEYQLFLDDAISGRKSERDGINKLMAAARNKEFELVGVVELSRIGRSMSFIAKTVEELSGLGIKVALINSNTVLDYATIEGSTLINALGMAAHIEWMLINERNQRARAKIKRDNIKVGAKRKDISLAAIKALQGKGMGYRQIAKELGTSPATVTRRLKEADTFNTIVSKMGNNDTFQNQASADTPDVQERGESETVFQNEQKEASNKEAYLNKS
jgi:DNA invertase Pin-like site-specific DNA recombinase